MVRFLILTLILALLSQQTVPCKFIKNWFKKGINVTEKNVAFTFYDKDRPQEHFTLTKHDAKFVKGQQRIMFLIHGWLENSRNQYIEDLRVAYLSRTDAKYGVVQVDYEKLAAACLYTKSVAISKGVAQELAELIIEINQKEGIDLQNIEITGFALGSQIAGLTAKQIIAQVGKKIGRINGLDPVGPLYTFKPPEQRLNGNDATVVMALHTNAGFFGFPKSCGTVDVWANGGSHQPGCPNFKDGIYCSHRRSFYLMIEAVKKGKMKATKCDNYLHYTIGSCVWNQIINFGHDIDQKVSGDFYLNTNSKPPYEIEETTPIPVIHL